VSKVLPVREVQTTSISVSPTLPGILIHENPRRHLSFRFEDRASAQRGRSRELAAPGSSSPVVGVRMACLPVVKGAASGTEGLEGSDPCRDHVVSFSHMGLR